MRNWGLGFSPPSSGGENHISKGESSDTFWEAKAAKRGEDLRLFFMAWEVLLPCQGSFCGITYFLDTISLMQVVGRAVHVLSSSSPQSYETQCGFLRLIFFLPKKDLPFVFS